MLGPAGVDDPLGKGQVGGEEEIEGSALDDLGGQGCGGLVRGFGVDSGLRLQTAQAEEGAAGWRSAAAAMRSVC